MKIAIFSRGRRAYSLESVNAITENIISSYLCLPGCQVELFRFDPFVRCPAFLTELKRFSPDVVVFVPVRGELFSVMKQLKWLSHRPKVVLHMDAISITDAGFGTWIRSLSLLSRFEFKMIALSKAHGRLLKSFFPSLKRSIHVFRPFVDPNAFFFDGRLRFLLRRSLGVGSSDRIIISASRRISSKNAKQLVEVVSVLGKRRVKLFFIGSIDANLRKISSSNIKFINKVSHAEMNFFYNIADAYISASSYFAEDFGMGAAEAMHCGLPLILTKWGGHLDFMPETEVYSIDIAGANAKVSVDNQSLHDVLLAFSKLSYKEKNRDVYARRQALKYSIARVQGRIRKILLRPFSKIDAFSPVFYEIALEHLYAKRSVFSRTLRESIINAYRGD